MEQSRPPSDFPSDVPLVGREEEIRELLGHLQETSPSSAGLLALHGEAGVGKTRLSDVLSAEAERRGWRRLRGQAFPPESRVPYATISDAFLPLLRGMSPERLAVLTRGGEAELAVLFPALDAPGGPAELPQASEPEEFRVRLFWTFTEFLGRLSSRDPVLVILEDLQWADASSLELLHFVVRNTPEQPIRFLGTYAEEFVEAGSRLHQMLGSLSATGLLGRVRLEPFSGSETRSLVSRLFEVPEEAVEAFADRIFQWTRGNAFFIVETLRSLVESGSLYRYQDTWLGWESDEWAIPGSVRDLVLGRIARCSELARNLTQITAVAGDRVSFTLLADVSEAAEGEVVGALEELRSRGILEEREEEGEVVCRFTHPLLGECVSSELGLVRARTLHGAMADAVKRTAAPLEDRVEELAYHYLRSGSTEAGARAIPHMVAAGRRALDRHADEEAADYLESALSLMREVEDEAGGGRAETRSDAGRPEQSTPVERSTVLDLLGRAFQRQGRYGEALAVWQDLLDEPEIRGSPDRSADVRRRMALSCFWSGLYGDALTLFEKALQTDGVNPSVRARARLGYGICLQEIARWDQARQAVSRALEEAEAVDDVTLRATAHRALALLHTWRGPPDQVRFHGSRAIGLAEEAGDRNVAFWGHWALAVLEGLTGHLDRMDEELAAARGVADEVRSPVMRLWTDELRIEKAYVTGEWEAGLALGERAVSLARTLEQRTLLPRLLVCTALFHFGRDDVDRGRKLLDQAWEVVYGKSASSPPSSDETPAGVSVHVAIPAHIGEVAYHLAVGEEEEAVRIGEEGLALAEESGYVIWGVHRLLPLMGEAYLLLRDLDGARRISGRMRAASEAMGHELGLAWADACDAMVTWLEGDVRRGALLLREAARRLESIPVVPEAARVRRQLAGRLAEMGDRKGALEELRRVHEVFTGIGAEREVKKVREQFRELESRPPAGARGPGIGELTGREVEVARLVAERSSNKAIAKRLGISPRTVGTHLSNIYRKLEISSREELADMVREGRLALEREEGTS